MQIRRLRSVSRPFGVPSPPPQISCWTSRAAIVLFKGASTHEPAVSATLRNGEYFGRYISFPWLPKFTRFEWELTHCHTRRHLIHRCTVTFQILPWESSKPRRVSCYRQMSSDGPTQSSDSQPNTELRFAALSFDDAHRSGTLYSSTAMFIHLLFRLIRMSLLFQCLQCDNRVFGHLPNQIVHHALVHLRSAASTSWCRFDLAIYLKSPHYVSRSLARNSWFVCELNVVSSLLETCHQSSAIHIWNSVISSVVRGLASEVYMMQNNCDILLNKFALKNLFSLRSMIITCRFTLTELLSRICWYFFQRWNCSNIDAIIVLKG